MIRDKQTERFNFVALNDKKAPFIKDWQHKSWGGKTVWKGQKGVGFKQSINHTTIDIDIIEMNETVDKLLWDMLPIVQSGSGKRHVLLAQTPESYGVGNSHLYKNGQKVADLLTCYNKQAGMPNYFDLDLPFSDKYKLLNGTEHDFFNPPQVNMFKVIDALGLSFKQPDLPPTRLSKPSKTIIRPQVGFDSFNVSNYVPTSSGLTNDNMGPLLRAIHFYGLEDRKDEIFSEYIFLCRTKGYGHKSDASYLNDWNGWNKSFNKNKIVSDIPLRHIKFKEIILSNLNQYKTNKPICQLIMAGSRGGNRDMEFLNRLFIICKDLAQYSSVKQFYLGCNWDVEGIDPKKVYRGLKTLELHGYIKLLQVGKQGKESKVASRYQLVERGEIIK